MKKDIQKLTQFFNQPYQIKDNRKFVLLVTTTLVVFVLAAFQPFGISQTNGFEYILTLCVYGLASALGSSITLYLFPALFKSYYAHWTIGKEIVAIILTILFIAILNGTTAVLLISIYYGYSPDLFIPLFYNLFIATLLVSPIPIIVLIILRKNQALSINLQEAQEINQQLLIKSSYKQGKNSQSILLTGITKDSVELTLNELLYLEAFGNYVKVNYRREDTTKQKLLRATIKQMEDQLQQYPSVIKCHRAFLVNLNNIQSVKGNSQGYRLIFDGAEEEVPVSRAYTKELKTQIEQSSLS